MITVSDKIKNSISSGMFGLFFEDINYALDGGLHAEMIENRNFEFYDCGGSKYNWYKRFDGMYGWKCPVGGSIRIDASQPQNEINPHYLVITACGEGTVVTNKAYDGIFMDGGKSYNVSAYVRNIDFEGELRVEIRRSAHGKALARTFLTRQPSCEWSRYETTIESDEDIRGGVFTVVLEGTGSVAIDFVSMKPADALYGVFRRDLADMLRDLRPGFLRFPGGCVVEGNTLDNMYKWKLSVGAPEYRKANWNRWAVHQNNGHGPFSHYNQSLGVGYFEYFLLCEYIGARPLPVCNVGMACQYESVERFELEDDIFWCFVQDALDLIEFANGDASTRWGGLRARMGHPEPFGLELIGIGNEQWNTPESRFFKRYSIFEQAIHQYYPDIRLIGSAGPDVTSDHYRDAWEYYHREAGSNPSIAYAVDEHYYVSPEWMIANNRFYDDYPRDVKVFAGEYAAHVGGDSKEPWRNCLRAAVAEASFMTGLERNSDVVVMASYAPLFARVGYVQWAPDMIWFDSEHAYGTPSYYVQKIFSTMTGDAELEVSADTEGLFVSASSDSSRHRSFLKVVNPTGSPVTDTLHIAGAGRAIVTTLTGDPDAYNSIDMPENIVPGETLVQLSDGAEYVFPAMSVTVFEY